MSISFIGTGWFFLGLSGQTEGWKMDRLSRRPRYQTADAKGKDSVTENHSPGMSPVTAATSL